jgi:hypothetical protein
MVLSKITTGGGESATFDIVWYIMLIFERQLQHMHCSDQKLHCMDKTTIIVI